MARFAENDQPKSFLSFYCLIFVAENDRKMKNISINTFEDIHHLCLMYGLKQAYLRFPFLARNIMVTPPPFRRNPKRPLAFIGGKFNPVCVQYYGKDIRVIYDEARVSDGDIYAFSQAIVEEYLRLRHPYMKYTFGEDSFAEQASGHVIARILRDVPATDGTL